MHIRLGMKNLLIFVTIKNILFYKKTLLLIETTNYFYGLIFKSA